MKYDKMVYGRLHRNEVTQNVQVLEAHCRVHWCIVFCVGCTHSLVSLTVEIPGDPPVLPVVPYSSRGSGKTASQIDLSTDFVCSYPHNITA